MPVLRALLRGHLYVRLTPVVVALTLLAERGLAMFLKLQRSQREAGLVGKSVLFCLDARVEFSPEEGANIRRYKLQDQVIYSSEAAKRAAAGSLAASANARAGAIAIGSVDDLLSSTASKMGSGLKAAALGALASMKLTITINSLQRGQHIECKSLDELLGAEEAIMDACRSLRGYLEAAATFDGREVLIDFSSPEPQAVASSPGLALVAPPSPQSSAALAAPAAPPAPHTPSMVSYQAPSLGSGLERALSVIPKEWQPFAAIIVGLALILLFFRACT